MQEEHRETDRGSEERPKPWEDRAAGIYVPLRPACAATPPLLTACRQRWQDRGWARVQGGRTGKQTGSKKKKKKKNKKKAAAILFYLCLLTALQPVSAQGGPCAPLCQEPGSAAAQGLAGPLPAATRGSRGLVGMRNCDTGLVGASGLLAVTCAATWRPGEVPGQSQCWCPQRASSSSLSG